MKMRQRRRQAARSSTTLEGFQIRMSNRLKRLIREDLQVYVGRPITRDLYSECVRTIQGRIHETFCVPRPLLQGASGSLSWTFDFYP